MTILVASAALFAATTTPNDEVRCSSTREEVVWAADSYEGLPSEVRRQIAILLPGRIADRGERILESDIDGDRNLPTPSKGFHSAYYTRHLLFVTFRRTSMVPLTITFYRDEFGSLLLHRGIYFSGPPCAVIDAALSGVTNAGTLPEMPQQ